MRKFTDLTEDEIRRLVNDIFNPKKITNIKVHKRDEEITCIIYTEWKGKDDQGNPDICVIADQIILRNPFEYGEDAIEAEFSLSRSDYLTLKQFCYAKGIVDKEWVKDNPYLEEKEENKDENKDDYDLE